VKDFWRFPQPASPWGPRRIPAFGGADIHKVFSAQFAKLAEVSLK